MARRFILLILDGFGTRAESEYNAIALAHSPTIDSLLSDYPRIELQTSGLAVGLPEGVMGNSEVGHMNIGAGRVVRQNLVRINDSITDGSFASHPILLDKIERAGKSGSTLHILGLCSDAGVHSHLSHLRAILETAAAHGLERVAFHALMDGRDTSPKSGLAYIKQVEGWMEELGVGKIASVVGRYYAMDRDQRWDRVEQAYRLYVHGEGERYSTAAEAVQASYDYAVGDEFIKPKLIEPDLIIKPHDALFGLNFRADRMRQIMHAFATPDFTKFAVEDLHLDIRSMTQYDASFTFGVLFPPEELRNSLPELLSRAGKRQLRLAETEKYAHVTYFLNCGVEEPYAGEDRTLVASPKVATYDLQPEMSAPEVTDRALEAIESGVYDGIIINFANLDMVGHTGFLEAAKTAVETIDASLSRILPAAGAQAYGVFVTADHGNAELMWDSATDGPHTAHTTNTVPLILVAPENNLTLAGTGKLADIAPTILEYLEMDIPIDMTGTSRLAESHRRA